MQVLHKIKEFKERILAFKSKNHSLENEQLVMGTQQMFRKMDTSGESFEPWMFLNKMF